MKKSVKQAARQWSGDILCAILAGMIVAFAYYVFQNSNGFAPGGVGGLATITYHLLGYRVKWAFLMLAFNLPIFALVTVFVNRKLGSMLMLYMVVQSLGVELFEHLGMMPYAAATAGEDFEIAFACIATGVISGMGFSLMLRRFGASGGTYAISALIKHWRPETNIAHLSFYLDAVVVGVAFFVYGRQITPVICTLINLFIANVVVDNLLAGTHNGYKFEIITRDPEALAKELIDTLGHGVTEVSVVGMYSHTDRYMLICIIRKRQVGKMMRIIKKYPDTFASFSKVSEVFGRFKK